MQSMGEYTQGRGNEPGEIVEIYRRPLAVPGREPGEIVEVYRPRDKREVVEQYSRPMPRGTEREAQKMACRAEGNPTQPGLLTGLFPQPEKPVERPEAVPDVSNPQAFWQPQYAAASMVPLRQRRRKRTGLRMFAFFLVTALLLTVGVYTLDNMGPADVRDPFEHYGWDWQEPEDLSDKTITIPVWPTGQGVELDVLQEHEEALTAREVYQQVNPSVVTVLVGVGGNRMSVGTGVIFTEDGYILTNYHVIEGGRDCSVVLDTGVRCEALYVAGDEKNDLAVLKAEPKDLRDLGGLPPAQFGDSDLLSVGDPVYAIGNPLGWELRGTLTDGIVSAINRDVEVDGRTMTLIQTNAALNSGNSGGPLINEYGQVVGINVIKMSSDYSTVEGLGFAIPSALMNKYVNDLLTWGEIKPEPLLGVTVLRVGAEAAEGVWGLEVTEVTPGSAADVAGILPGDFLLTADGEALHSLQDLTRVRRRFHLDDELSMTLWRDGETMEVVLRLRQAVG